MNTRRPTDKRDNTVNLVSFVILALVLVFVALKPEVERFIKYLDGVGVVKEYKIAYNPPTSEARYSLNTTITMSTFRPISSFISIYYPGAILTLSENDIPGDNK